MPEFVERPAKKFPWITRIFLFLYLVLLLTFAALPFFYEQIPFLSTLGLGQEIVMVPSFVAAFYCLLIAFSFWRAGDNWLILTIILLFFSSLAALVLGGIGALNARTLWEKGLPSCYTDINSCNSEQGIILLSAVLLGISIPTLVFNILTFVAVMKSFGARDTYA
jgi:hypothetical protein